MSSYQLIKKVKGPKELLVLERHIGTGDLRLTRKNLFTMQEISFDTVSSKLDRISYSFDMQSESVRKGKH